MVGEKLVLGGFLSKDISEKIFYLRKMRKFCRKNRKCTFSLHCVGPEEVDKIISSLKNSKSCGLDYIDTYIIELSKPIILLALTHIINLSIKNSTFPSDWKVAKSIPVHKKDDILNPQNFRPVAILPRASKNLERIIFNQIISFMDENSLFHPNHHGYRSGHSTATALIQMYDSWLEAAEEGRACGVVMLVMSAAFDVVPHKIFNKKI